MSLVNHHHKLTPRTLQAEDETQVADPEAAISAGVPRQVSG